MSSEEPSIPRWTTNEYDMTSTVNDLYESFGKEPNSFFRELVCHMYGDLLSFFKLSVKRAYADEHRTTRESLESFDPTGYNVIIGEIKYNKYILEIMKCVFFSCIESLLW